VLEVIFSILRNRNAVSQPSYVNRPSVCVCMIVNRDIEFCMHFATACIIFTMRIVFITNLRENARDLECLIVSLHCKSPSDKLLYSCMVMAGQ
jgi:hypothetical protein